MGDRKTMPFPDFQQVEGINKWHYKQRCHDPCFLTNVPKEVIGSPELVNCAAIDKLTKACTKCQCDFSIHMHVYYLSKTLINDISQRKEELEKEHGIIIKTCARFAHFLQNNAITPFSDSYKEYVEYLILRCQTRKNRPKNRRAGSWSNTRGYLDG
ncbi:hypothetical protein NQ315_002461 [Exocentrus adspersus]|uniref:DUF8206 domain-containing protein n=1 Tax=Exocentrus adspersus TaxID=1586481 RepID=A0AAV8V801_9CUCU|nr:hypothetical protein NQ315_002461 [Exocentrus adspersus]